MGVGGEQAPPVEGFPQELLQGQKFTVVSISPFSSQSANRDCADPRGCKSINSLATKAEAVPLRPSLKNQEK